LLVTRPRNSPAWLYNASEVNAGR